MSVRSRPATAFAWSAAAVVLAAACHQAAVALGWLPIGRLPGEGAAGERYLLDAALLVLVLAGFALFAACTTDLRVSVAPAIALAAALLVVARFYAYDPYYAPSLRRMSDGGAVAGTWIVIVVAACAGAALLALRARRSGLAAVALVCWVSFGTAFAAGLGH